jgi:POT family proton-dependent oligopeptide transporter
VPQARFLGHPRGLAYLAFAEAWERFSFYGMQALLVLYMVGDLLQPERTAGVLGLAELRSALGSISGPLSGQALASAIFGTFAAAIYLTPILGGAIADRFLGRRRTVILGALLMAFGHFLMAFEQPFLIALLCLALGAGCFKGNIASQVSGLYAPGDQRRTDAFQIFYLCINGGAIAAPLVCGTLGETLGWSYGFGVAGIGMLVGLGIYLAGRQYYAADPVAVSRAVAKPLDGQDKARLALLIGMLPIFAIALVANQQVGNAYLLWAKDSVDTSLAGHSFPVTWLLTLESVATVICLPGSVVFWRWWAGHRAEPDEMTKIVIGTSFLAAAPLILAIASASFIATGSKISVAWLVVFAFINEIGFANVLPVALALYARAAPARFGSTIIGIYYLQLVGANLLMGLTGGLLGRMPDDLFWGLHAGLAALAVLLFTFIRITASSLLRPGSAPSDRHSMAAAEQLRPSDQGNS